MISQKSKVPQVETDRRVDKSMHGETIAAYIENELPECYEQMSSLCSLCYSTCSQDPWLVNDYRDNRYSCEEALTCTSG